MIPFRTTLCITSPDNAIHCHSSTPDLRYCVCTLAGSWLSLLECCANKHSLLLGLSQRGNISNTLTQAQTPYADLCISCECAKPTTIALQYFYFLNTFATFALSFKRLPAGTHTRLYIHLFVYTYLLYFISFMLTFRFHLACCFQAFNELYALLSAAAVSASPSMLC